MPFTPDGNIAEQSPNLDHIISDEFRAYRDAININTIVSITDPAGRIIYVNDKFCEISKYSRSELLGQDHRIINSGYHPRSFFSTMWRSISSGNSWRAEILNKAKDGTLYWVDSVIMPVFNANQKISRYLSIRNIITERKESEARIQLYTEALEELAFNVSHNFRSPICSILGLTNLLTRYPSHTLENDEELRMHLMAAAGSLDKLASQMSELVNQFQRKVNVSILSKTARSIEENKTREKTSDQTKRSASSND
jgi:PAS domain S-box-containing protein